MPLFHSARNGSIYVFVLGVSLLVAVIGLSVLTLAQISARAASSGNNSAEAAMLAQSAIEYAEVKIATNSSWRTTYSSGVATTPVTLGRGTMSFILVDPNDGNLSNNSTDPVKIYGIGNVGNATRVCSVVSGVYNPPLSCLGVAIDSSSSIVFLSPAVTGSGTIAGNGTLSGTAALNSINMEAGGSIVGSFAGSGNRTSGATLRNFPDSTAVFSYYSSNGRSVSYGSIPSVSGYKTISKVLFAPNNNPYGGGSNNSQGIYIINMSGNSLVINNSRIVGTLVILNAGTVTVGGSNIFEPSLPGYPVLMVQGNLTLSGSSSNLSENSIGVNLNPSGVPYPYNNGAGGTSNSTTTDSYPSVINGLVYASGVVTTSSGTQNTLNGVLVCGGSAIIGGNLQMTYDSTYNSNPASGFTAPAQLGINTGSWKWEQAP